MMTMKSGRFELYFCKEAGVGAHAFCELFSLLSTSEEKLFEEKSWELIRTLHCGHKATCYLGHLYPLFSALHKLNKIVYFLSKARVYPDFILFYT